jgi:hypothetical protein
LLVRSPVPERSDQPSERTVGFHGLGTGETVDATTGRFQHLVPVMVESQLSPVATAVNLDDMVDLAPG